MIISVEPLESRVRIRNSHVVRVNRWRVETNDEFEDPLVCAAAPFRPEADWNTLPINLNPRVPWAWGVPSALPYSNQYPDKPSFQSDNYFTDGNAVVDNDTIRNDLQAFPETPIDREDGDPYRFIVEAVYSDPPSENVTFDTVDDPKFNPSPSQ